MADIRRDLQLDAIVNEVVSEAHINRSLLLPEEIQYIREHALNNPPSRCTKGSHHCDS